MSRLLEWILIVWACHGSAAMASNGSVCARNFGEIDVSVVAINKINKSNLQNHLSANGTIDQILVLQRSLIATRDAANESTGFLISNFSREELIHNIVDDGTLLVAQKGSRLAGYALITPVSEFTNLLSETIHGANVGSFKPSAKLDYSKLRYLYQIATDKEFSNMGIASILLASALEAAEPFGLLTDVLSEPVENRVSIRFFEKHEFTRVGILELSAYRDFGKLKSIVLQYNR